MRVRVYYDTNGNGQYDTGEPNELGPAATGSCARLPPTFTPIPTGTSTPTIAPPEAPPPLTGGNIDCDFQVSQTVIALAWDALSPPSGVSVRYEYEFDDPIAEDEGFVSTRSLVVTHPGDQAFTATFRVRARYFIDLDDNGHYDPEDFEPRSVGPYIELTCSRPAPTSTLVAIPQVTDFAIDCQVNPDDTLLALSWTQVADPNVGTVQYEFLSGGSPVPAIPPVPSGSEQRNLSLPGDAGFTAVVSIRARYFVDSNGNGAWESGEPSNVGPYSQATCERPAPTNTPTITLTPAIPPPETPPALPGGNIDCAVQTSQTVITISWDALVPPDGVLVRYEYQFDDPIAEDDDYTVTRSLMVTHPGDAAFVATFRVRARYFIDLNDNGTYDAGDLEPSSVGPYIELTCSRPAPTSTLVPVPQVSDFAIDCQANPDDTDVIFTWTQVSAPNIGTLQYEFLSGGPPLETPDPLPPAAVVWNCRWMGTVVSRPRCPYGPDTLWT